MTTDELCRPRPAHGLQAMMLRWEQWHPVNAVQVAWLNRTISADSIQRAAQRVLRRLSGRPASSAVPRPALERTDSDPTGFEFQHRPFVGDWRAVLQGAVTNELNRPYGDAEAPWRLFLFESPVFGQFLGLGYRHVIADARSVALVLHEIIRLAAFPDGGSTGFAAEHRPESLRELFPAEFRWRRLPSMLWKQCRELWASRRAYRPPCNDPRDLEMQFRIHGNLSLADVKAAARRYDATINDVLFAAILEWLAGRFPPEGRGNRPELAVAALADLTSRSATALPNAFGQYLSQFAVRLAVEPGTPFEEIVRRAGACSQEAKATGSLIDAARGFVTIAVLSDWLPFTRRPEFLPALIPLLAGVSNVHLASIVNDPGTSSAIRSYCRGTCVTNVLPMMLSLTTVGDACTLTTTHRPAVFSAGDMTSLAAHLHDRLAPARQAAIRAAA